MAKTKKSTKVKRVTKKGGSFNILSAADVIGLLSAVWFTASITNNTYDMTMMGINNSAASYLLFLALACVLYTFAMRKRLDSWNGFVFGLLVASTAVWLFGLNTLNM